MATDSNTLLNEAKCLGCASNASMAEMLKLGLWSRISEGDSCVSNWDTEIIKSADQTVTNSTTMENDTELFTSIEANSFYLVEMELLYSGNNTASDYVSRFLFPNITGGTSIGYYYHPNFALSPTPTPEAGAVTIWPGSGIQCGTDAADSLFTTYIRFLIKTVANAGTLQYQFCGNALGAGRTSTTRAGTVLRVKRLWPNPEATGEGWDVVKTKTSDQNVVGTTYTNDAELFTDVAANAFYLIEIDILYTGSGTNDYKGRFLFPNITGGTSYGFITGLGTTLVAYISATQSASVTAWPNGEILGGTNGVGAPFLAVHARFLLRTTATSGVLNYQFANLLGGGTVTTFQGTTMRVKRLA